jgi:tetratricopeptide (TPR) repeat protein
MMRNVYQKLTGGLTAVHCSAIILLVAAAVYVNILPNDFVMDDFFHIHENSWIKFPRFIPEIFTTSFWGVDGGKTSFYRPLIYMFFMAGYQLFGLQAWGYHLFNILLHGGASVLVFLLVERFLKSSAAQSDPFPLILPLLAGLLFATHPIHTEPVAWVSGIIDVSYTFFFLLSLILYIQTSEQGRLYGPTHIFSVLSFFLATLCKEPAVTLPAFLLLYDYAFSRKKPWSYYGWKYLPFLAAAGLYFLLRTNALGGFAPARVIVDLTPYQCVINIPVLFSLYLKKLLLPINLNVWHVFHPVTSLLTTRGSFSLLMGLAYIGTTGLAFFISRRIFFCLVLLLLPLLPALYIPNLSQGVENAFAERYLYLPSVGFVLLVVLLLHRLTAHKPKSVPIVMVCCAGIIGFYSLVTVTRNTDWKDMRTLWTDAAEKSPESASPRAALGDDYRLHGLYEEALAQYTMILQKYPDHAGNLTSIALTYAAMNQLDRAIEFYEKALRAGPQHNVEAANIHNNLGVAYAQKGDAERAMGHFLQAVAINPQFAQAHNNLGLALSNAGRQDQAINAFRRAITLKPDFVDAYVNLGIAYGRQGSIDKAIEQFQAALALAPDNPVARQNLEKAQQMEKGVIRTR